MNVFRIPRAASTYLAAAAVGLFLTVSAAPYVAAAPEAPAGAQFDLSGNQVVNGADVAEAGAAWTALLEGAQPATTIDLNGDGALDIADIQLVASQTAQGTTEAALKSLGAPVAPQEVPEKVFVVNSAASGSPIRDPFRDKAPGDGKCETSLGTCTLQAALQETNAPRVPAYRARITFDIRDEGGLCPSVVRILPDIDYERWLQLDDSSGQGTVIDGYTQCDAEENTADVDGNAAIKIEIVGTKFSQDRSQQYTARDGVNGIEIKSANNVIRGLALYNWDRQIEISAAGALYNRIEGNFIGTDAGNTFLSRTRTTHHGEGIRLQFGASYTVIGCGSFVDGTFVSCPSRVEANAARNIVAGNGNDGIHIERFDSNFNRIVGNYIGVSQSGRVQKAGNGSSLSKNQADGVDFEAGANNNWLGGEGPYDRNIIAGNVSEGIEISHNSRTQNNRVVGNYIGLDAYGDAQGNGDNGVSFEDTANNNHVYGNYIGSNGDSGVRSWVLAHENQIYENRIGLAPDDSARGNKKHGVFILGGSQRNVVRSNEIANNADRGVVISTDSDVANNYFGETYYNTISKNSIYNNTREGIRLTNREDPAPRGNQNLEHPVILGANTSLVVGTTCPYCRVEIFISDKTQLPDPVRREDNGEGKTFIGEAVATGGGEFAVVISGVNAGQLITATGTDSTGNTSEFARNFRVGSGAVATLTPRPTVTPSPTPPPLPSRDNAVFLPMTSR
jgi:parallel beta-helix repeat protein